MLLCSEILFLLFLLRDNQVSCEPEGNQKGGIQALLFQAGLSAILLASGGPFGHLVIIFTTQLGIQLRVSWID